MSRKSIVVPIAALLAVALLTPAPAYAQGIRDRLKTKVQERAEKGLDAALEKMLDRIEKAVKCVAGDDECIEKAKKAKKDVVLTDEAGKILPAEEQPEGSPAKNEKANQAAQEKAAGKDSEGAAKGPAAKAVIWDNFDFVPGARPLFTDDFSRERVGNFPRRLELARGNAQVVERNGARWLQVEEGIFAIPLPEVLPVRWTVEMDVMIPWWGSRLYVADKPDLNPGERDYPFIELSGTKAGIVRGNAGSFVDPRSFFPDMKEEDSNLSRPFKLRIETDGDYTKVYLDQARIANYPSAKFPRANKIYFEVDDNPGRNDKSEPMMFANISVNAGGKDMYDALLADGRLAVQGIYFDTNSDVIRPESTGTLKQIGDMLKSHADLKLLIEGHTDNTGNAAANQTLSEKRAAAVVAYLNKNFGIEAGRLSSKGFGPSKPAASNDTPEGRQQNRRVELVKQ